MLLTWAAVMVDRSFSSGVPSSGSIATTLVSHVGLDPIWLTRRCLTPAGGARVAPSAAINHVGLRRRWRRRFQCPRHLYHLGAILLDVNTVAGRVRRTTIKQ
jgi:hypothetical protein